MSVEKRRERIKQIIKEVEVNTQGELARLLTNEGFSVTQATVSRDIKELGLTKILSSSGKYKYCIVGAEEQVISNKYINIFKESVISVKVAMNLVVLKTMKGMAQAITSFVDKLNINELMGATSGEDTVMLIFPTTTHASEAVVTINDMLN